MAKGDDIEERLIDFSVRILRVCEALPKDQIGTKHVCGQLVRSGTSPAPNYGEARAAESSKDFVHKLKIVLKELNESRVWLKIAIRVNWLPEHRLDDLLDECDQLCRIMSRSIHTARSRSQ